MSHIQTNDEANTVIPSQNPTNVGDVRNSVAVDDEDISHISFTTAPRCMLQNEFLESFTLAMILPEWAYST